MLRIDFTKFFSSFQAKQYERERWEREREELLHMKFTTNANSNLENGSETAILIDRALEHSSALHVSQKVDFLHCATICLQFHFRDQIEELMIYSAMVTQF